MKKNFVLVAIAIISIFLMWGIQHYLQSTPTSSPVRPHTSPQSPNTFTTKVAGLTFTYFGGRDGYQITERFKGNNDVDALLYSLTLMTTKDAAELNDRVNTEGPPMLQLSIYTNELHESLDNWITNHAMLSNSTLKTTPVEHVTVAGEPAVSYTIDGLYPNQVTVIARDNYILVAYGAYLDTSSKTYQDYGPWLSSFIFTSTK